MIKKTMCAIAAVAVLAACEVVPVQTEAQGNTVQAKPYCADIDRNHRRRAVLLGWFKPLSRWQSVSAGSGPPV